MSRRWHPVEDAKLAEMWGHGSSLMSIAFELKRTDAAVKQRRKALGLPARKPEARTRKLRVLLDEATYWKVGSVATAKGMHLTAYVRELILREIGPRA